MRYSLYISEYRGKNEKTNIGYRLKRLDTAARRHKFETLRGNRRGPRHQGTAVDLFELDGSEFKHTFLVCELPMDTAGLLGTDFMQETGAVIDSECGKMSLTGMGAGTRVNSGSSTGHTALTVVTQDKEGHSPQPNEKEVWQLDTQLSACSKHETKASQDISWFVRARPDIILAFRCRQVVTARLESEEEQKLRSLVCIEPVQIPIQGIFPARALSWVEHSVASHVN